MSLIVLNERKKSKSLLSFLSHLRLRFGTHFYSWGARVLLEAHTQPTSVGEAAPYPKPGDVRCDRQRREWFSRGSCRTNTTNLYSRAF